MEERAVADYFVVAGLPENPERLDEFCEGLNPTSRNIEPITDITVIFPSLGELVPRGFVCVEFTPSGFSANLNSGSIRSPDVYLCYRRGNDKPPLVDIGVIYDGKEQLMADAEVVISTPEGRSANVNNTSARTFLTFRRAPDTMPCNELVVTDVCVIMSNKGERPPHAFCQITKNLNKGLMGGDIFLCYKKSMNRPPLLTYKPEVLLRYPPFDRRGFPFPSSVGMFCLPMCATVECWPVKATQPRPVFSTFVLTVADASEKIYGAAVTFYEEYPMENLNLDQKVNLGLAPAGQESEKSVHVNKSICLLSHYPFFDPFKSFLIYLYMMSRTGEHEIPIERYISHLFEGVPYPSIQRPHILMQLSATQSVHISHAQDSPLPKSGASFRTLLNNLGPDNCLMVLLLVLTEQKLLIHSLRPDALTSVAEAVQVLIFPFNWECPYIPLCPLGLSDVLQAPVPFLVGVDSRFFDLYELPSDITCIDLDTNTVTVSEDKRALLNLKILPKKPARILRNSLEMLYQKMFIMRRMQSAKKRPGDVFDIDFQSKKQERMLELEIQEAFLRFMTSIMKNYRSFLLPITKAPTARATDASSRFDFQSFLRSRDKNYQKFYMLILKTQMFIRFIEERSFVSDIDTGLAFFDECIEKLEQEETESIRLLEFSESTSSERTVFVLPPDPTGLPPNTTYFYDSVFKLNEGLFTPLKFKLNSLSKVQQQLEFSTPGSPVAKRTKQEIMSAQRNAKKYVDTPKLWARCLLSTCYSLWFIHLPSYLIVSQSKHRALYLAYEMIVRMTKSKLEPADEVCYRVVMQLCGLYNQPMVAIKVLFEMKRSGVTPNAITYGFYNKAVLEAQWPSNVTNSSQLMWNKLRNVINGIAHFRAAGKQLQGRRMSQSTADEVDRLSTESGGSGDSQVNSKGKSGHPPSDNLTTAKVADTPQSTIPTRISSSSDIGYASGADQKISSEEEDSAGTSERPLRLLDKMGQSLDHWVKAGVANIAQFASSEAGSYFSPAGLVMSSNYRDNNSMIENYRDEEIKPKGMKSQRRLDFNELDSAEKAKGEKGETNKTETLRLLRSVSFGNDTQIMSKLKGDLKKNDDEAKVDDDGNLEAKVNEFLEGASEANSESISVNNSREVTPYDGSEIYDNSKMQPPRSPNIAIKKSQSANSRIEMCKEDLSPASPARTPVTQNDPLGALDTSQTLALGQSLNQSEMVTNNIKHSPKRTCSEGHIEGILPNGFKYPMVPGSDGKHFHRSSTLPNYPTSLTVGPSMNSEGSTPNDNISCTGGSSTNVVSSLSAITNFKNPFGRYSPARISLRKAGTSLIESTLGGKKAEALMEGFNQFRSAAAVTAKRTLVDFKEAMGNNNTPAGRNGPFGRSPDERDEDDESGDSEDGEVANDQWASVTDSYLDQVIYNSAIGKDSGSTRASFASDLPLGLHDTPLSSSSQSLIDGPNKGIGRKDRQYPVAVEINMTTCSICHNCSSLLFDEEIMAGWTAEDSNLNTRCPHCKKWEVPFLQVTIRDYRHHPLSLVAPTQLSSKGLSSALSLGSMNSLSSRRHSLFHPPDSITNSNASIAKIASENLISSSKEKLAKQSEEDKESSPRDSINLEIETKKEEPLQPMDPLGVLEDKQQQESSRRNSTELPNPPVTFTPSSPKEETEPEIPEIKVIPEPLDSDPIIVPYLSPLVLRKELENVLENEGDSALVSSKFVDEHPIIYWNLVWFFHRANLSSHIKGLALGASSVKPKSCTRLGETKKNDLSETEEEKVKVGENSEEVEEFKVHPSWSSADYRNILIKCNWDNPKYYDEYGIPLYVKWMENQKKTEECAQSADTEMKLDNNNKLISDVLKAVQRNDLYQISSNLLFYYHKQARNRHYPVYREMLFLALKALPKESFNINLYDREFPNVYGRLRNCDEQESMDLGDMPPSVSALLCRGFFRELQL